MVRSTLTLVQCDRGSPTVGASPEGDWRPCRTRRGGLLLAASPGPGAAVERQTRATMVALLRWRTLEALSTDVESTARRVAGRAAGLELRIDGRTTAARAELLDASQRHIGSCRGDRGSSSWHEDRRSAPAQAPASRIATMIARLTSAATGRYFGISGCAESGALALVA